MSYKRDFDDSSNDSHLSREERRKKRKSRWEGSETDKVVIPGLSTTLPSNLTKEQQEIYLLQIQIESITRSLRTGDLGIPDDPEKRSPSPEPIYNSDGKRLNTREFRVRKKLEDERHQLITRMLVINPTFNPPADYKPPQTKLSDKVLIPQEEYPDINFVGLLIGPRGNTLKSMEKDTGAKIIIRGKGSIKEGKLGRKDGQPLPGEDEPLHAFLTAPTEKGIQAATAQIMKIIKQAIELPENQNNLRRTQLRELALLNGTLRENDTLSKRFCSNCGSVEHRNWQCPEKINMVNQMLCTKCNGRGHLEKDCKFVAPENGIDTQANQSNMDEEYLSLMAELGECSPPLPRSNTTSTTNNHSTTTVSSGGPLALTYDKSSSNEGTQNGDSNQNGVTSSNALLPTPSSNNTTSSSSSSDKPKTVTWIQKQGVWKQVVQETSESNLVSTSNEQTSSTAVTTTTDSSIPLNSSTTSSTNPSVPTYISSDPFALNYYNTYLQQSLSAGQDMQTAMATALAAYNSYVSYTGYVSSTTMAITCTAPTTNTDSSSKYSSTSYSAVPPPTQLSDDHAAVSTPATSSTSYIPSANYGYAMPPVSSIPTAMPNVANNYSVYAAYYSMLGQQIPPVSSQPPPPPE